MAIKTAWKFIAIDAVTKNANRIVNSVDKIDKKMKKAGITAEAFGKSLKKSANQGIGKFKELALAAGAFFGARQFFTVGTAFQDQIAELSAITGAAGKDLSFLSDEALRLSKTSVIAQDKVAEAFKLIASAKDDLLKDPAGLSRVTEQVLLLANASKVELGTAAEFVGQSLNQFGAGADQAARFVNVMAAGAKEGASEVEDTGTALLKVGVVARQAGLSFEATNGALQTLALVGLKAEIAGTGLSGVISRLGRLGINFKNQSPGEVFVNLKEKLALVTDETKKAVILQKLFGTEHLKTGLALVENADRIDGFTKKLTGTNTAQKQAAINMRTFSFTAKGLGVSINEVLIKTFLKIEPMLAKATVAVTKFFNEFDESSIEAISLVLGGFIEILSTLLGLVGKLANVLGFVFKPIMAILKGVGTAIGEQAAAIATGDILVRSDNGTSFKDAFSLGGRFLGVGEKSLTAGVAKKDKSEVAIDLNLSGNTDAVNSVSAKSKGASSLPVKTNMAGK